MRKTIVCLALALVFAACSRSRIDRDQRQYDVVQEGAATGVTSTIGAPGETLPPMTGTNADTTTAFTLDPRLSTAPPMQQPGTIAGTLPAPGSMPPAYGSQPTPRPAETQTTRRAEPTYTPPPTPAPRAPAPQPPMTSPTPAPQPSTPPAVDTAAPPPTDTTTTTDGSTPPPDKPKKEKKPKPSTPPPPTDTTATDTAPPPTATDTGGQGR